MIRFAKAKKVRRRRRRLTRATSLMENQAARDIVASEKENAPKVTRSFNQIALDLRGAIPMRQLIEAIDQGNIQRAIEISGVQDLPQRLRGVGLEPGDPSFVERLTESLRDGGVSGQRLTGRRRSRLVASLDLTNPQAVEYLRRNLPLLIREITDSSRIAVNAALLRGFNEGRPAPQIAREIRDSVGLTQAGNDAVRSFRRQLETGELGGTTAPWMRRLSAVEQRQARALFNASAIGETRVAAINALVTRYGESLVNRRAKDIARTEVNRAFGSGQSELWRQATEQGLLDPEETIRFWLVTGDDRLRDSHLQTAAMNVAGVRLDEFFDTPVGPVSRPRESGNAGFDVNCRCTVVLRFSDLF